MTDTHVTAQELHGPRLTWALGQAEHARKTITVTRYGLPIARIVPVSDDVSLTDVPLPFDTQPAT